MDMRDHPNHTIDCKWVEGDSYERVFVLKRDPTARDASRGSICPPVS